MTQSNDQPDRLYSSHLDQLKSVYTNAIEETGSDGLLIHSGSLKTAFLDDRTYPFIANPHFKSWLPLVDSEECFILFKPSQTPILFFHQADDYWHKAPSVPDDFWTRHWDLVPISSLSDAHNKIGDTNRLTFIGENTELAENWKIGQINPSQLLQHLHFERSYKTDYEISCITKANQIAVQGHQEAENAFREGLSEFEIQLRYLAAIKHREKDTPYSSIVGLNENCAVLHYQHYEQNRIPASDLHSLLIDAGASYSGYASDVTRTHAFRQGEFNDLICAMDTEQQGVISEIKVGMTYPELHAKMHEKLAAILRQFDFVRLSEDLIMEENITHTFMPHGLGHFLGLQTHDVSGFQQDSKGHEIAAPEKYSALRLTRPIQNRQVFTIEPGLYFIDSLLNTLHHSKLASSINWDKINAFKKFGGIRIEDNIAMVEDKAVNLTRTAFDNLH